MSEKAYHEELDSGNSCNRGPLDHRLQLELGISNRSIRPNGADSIDNREKTNPDRGGNKGSEQSPCSILEPLLGQEPTLPGQMNPKRDQIDQSNTDTDQERSSQLGVIPNIGLQHTRVGQSCSNSETSKEVEVGEEGSPGPGAESVEVAEREGNGQIGSWYDIEKTRTKDCTD